MNLKLLLQLVLPVLQGTIKNPKSVAKQRNILVEVRDVLNQLLIGIDKD